MDLRSQPHEQRWLFLFIFPYVYRILEKVHMDLRSEPNTFLRVSVLSCIMLVSIPNDSKCCAAQTFQQHLKPSRCTEARLPPWLTWSWWRHLVRNSLFPHLCFCFRSKHPFFVSDHMISFKTAFFNIFASVFVQNSFFSYLITWFRSKHLFFVSVHMISLETAFFPHLITWFR